jgi:hypothetical protein
VESVVKRQSEELLETRRVAQANLRLEVPRAFLETAIKGFQDPVHNLCTELVFHLGEKGISEWEDCPLR